MRKERKHTSRKKRYLWVNVAVLMALFLSLAQGLIPGTTVPTVYAHNLQTKMVYMFFDSETQDLLDTRIPTLTPPEPLLRVGDELGLIIKVVPRDGTDTGVGGYIDFYVPDGVTVVDAAYLLPDGSGGFEQVPMKGQSLIAVGDGPVGTNCTPALGDPNRLHLGPNINGVEADAVDAAGCHNGTVAGVYGDIGIFYSTDPDTNYNSWTEYGGYDGNPATSDNTITNNSGDVIVPLNKWDAEQLLAYGSKAPASPIVDPNGRGNAPWGNANGVAGPQSGYAWQFDWEVWKATGNMKDASNDIGPWKRTQYPGSMISYDKPGLKSTTLGIASIDASTIGYDLSPSHPLPSTVSQTDTTSPKVVRWSIGQTTLNVPEYAWVKIRVDDTSAILQPDGCPYFHAGTFGGDAGGDANGKDHLWRYYEPSRVTWNGCVAIGKPATREVVKVGDVFQYKIKFYNAGTLDLTNVVVRDTLPGGVQFISAFPAQDSGPNPLVWNVGSLLRGQKFETTVTVKATGTGDLENTVTVTSEQLPPQTVTEITLSGSIPILKQSKSVTPTSVAPGGTVQYTVLIENIGSGPSGSPVEIHEYLPSDFTYVSLDSVTVNGANVIGSTTVDNTNPNEPVFTVPFAINAGSELALVFTAQTSATIQPGPYCNSYTSWQNDLPLTTGAQACVTIGGGKIGDTIFRDWNGDGVQDLVDEGVEGVTVDLYQDVDGDGAYETFVGSATTDANGKYLFEGLVEGNYRVVVTDTAGKLIGYTLTADPDGGVANQADLTLGDGQQRYDIDFGYQPGGAGVIGDTVWKDDGTGGGIMGNGIQDGAEPGIANVTVWLYEDTNGNGIVDTDDYLVATTETNTNGNYSFTGLAEGINYLVDVDGTDPDLITAVGTPVAASTDDPISVPNLTGTYPDADFGFYQVPPATINGTVFGDENGDGDYDDGIDNLLADVEVYLYKDLNGNGVLDPGEPSVASTTTDANGDYSFTNLPPGDYIVDVAESDPDVPDGYVPSTDEIAVSLAEGETRDNVDFPFVQLLRKEVNLTSASGGDTLTYTLYPSYPGSELLTNVTVSDDVPAGTTFLSAGQGGTESGGIVTWNLGSNTAGVPGVDSISYLCPGGIVREGGCTEVTSNFVAADTYISSDFPDTNYDGATMYTRVSSGADIERPLFSFDVSSIPSNATVLTATLSMRTFKDNSGIYTVDVKALTQSWTESGATWNTYDGSNNWAAPGGDFGATVYGSFTTPTKKNATFNVDLTPSLVQSWVDTPSSNNGVILDPDNTGTVWTSYRSGDTTLEVIYVTPDVTQQIMPSQDAFIDKEKPTQVQNQGELRTRIDNNANRRKRSLLQFDLSSNIPTGATINSATFNINVESGQTTGQTVEIRALTNSWGNTQVTWNDRLTSTPWDTVGGGGDFAATDYGSFVPATTGWHSIDVITLTQVWWDGPITNYGLILTPNETAFSNSDVKYRSMEDAGLEPYLEINYTAPVVSVGSRNTLSASPSLVSSGDTIQVSMVLITSETITNVTPSALAVSGSNGVSATLISGPTPAPPQDVISGTQRTFIWVYQASDTGSIGQLIFSGDATGAAGTSFAAAASNGVLVSPPLTFQVTVNSPTTLPSIENTAYIQDSNVISPTGSNTVVTTLPTGSIGDLNFYDKNGDGVQQPAGEDGIPGTADDETGVPGATMLLFKDDNGNGILDEGELIWVQETSDGTQDVDSDGVIDPVGYYNFTNLPPGNYVIEASGQSVESPTTPGLYGTMVPTTGEEFTRTITCGGGTCTEVTDADFGFIEGAVLEGTVFHDENHDGALNGSDSGLAGITVYLYDSEGNLVDTATTDANGEYSFLVAPGDYTIEYDTSATTAAGYTEATTPTSLLVSANAGQEIAKLNFGVDHAGKIGNLVWNDANGDGSPAGELGIPGVTVNLYDSTGTALLATTVTDGNGEYLFEGLPDGNYVVKVDTSTVPTGYTQTGDPEANNDSQGSATVSGGGFDDSMNFGYQPPAPHNVSGTIFEDLDDSGTPGIGEGREGVTVYLYDSTGANLIAMTTTDPNGDYTFTGIVDGDYIVRVDTDTLPSTAYFQTVDPDATLNNETPITVSGADVTNEDFGYKQNLGSISGTVCDGDGDGLCDDPGDTPLSGILVSLTYAGPDGILGTDDDTVTTTTTDASGNYTFPDLPPGIYQVTKSDPAGYTSLADADGGNSNNISINLGIGEDRIDQDFEVQPPATVGDSIWLDEDGDGVQDAGEAGIPNVTVQLIGPGPDGILGTADDVVVATTTTDADGGYVFTDVEPGDYLVTVDTATMPAGLAANSTYDEDGTGTLHTTTVTVASGEEHMTADFGYNWAPTSDVTGNTGSGAIGDRVWIDADGDGVQDPGEAGLDNVTVKLYNDPDGDGVYDNLVAATTTDEYGNYIFDGLIPDAYVVEVNDGATPAGYTQTGDPDATLDNQSEPIALAPGDVFVNADFGYDPDAGSTIGDTIYFDADGDGVYEPGAGEYGIPGVTVTLLDNAGNVIATTTTDENGTYSFPGLPSGTYAVWVNDTDNVLGELTQSGDPDGGLDSRSTLTVDGTTDNLLQDHGYAPAGQDPGEGVIGDIVFLDRNGNNTPDAGEGLEGVVVELYDATGTTLLAKTTTDQNGHYSFGGLDPNGTYTVKVDTTTLPAGVTNTVDPEGDGNSTSVRSLSTTGPVDLNADFGYQDLTNPNTISGTIWDDTDGDGTLEGGETGRLEGVTVALYDADGNIVATTTTDANGNYSFPGLPDGTYTVDVTDDNNVLNGYWHSDGPNDGFDNNSQTDPYQVTVTSGQTNTTADFGYYAEPAALGNWVWNDLNRDGIQDPGEAGIPDVTVTLTITYPDGTVVDVTTTTDASGYYSFDNLLLDESFDGVGTPGMDEPTFVITVETPTDYTPSATDQTTEDKDSDNPAGEQVFPTQGSTNNDYDFGFMPRLGVVLDPDNYGSALSGETVTYSHILTNTGTITDTYNLTYYSNQGYTVTVYVNGVVTDVVPNLGPGESVAISVTIEIPPTALEHTLDTTTIIATSITDGTVLDTAHDYTSIRPMIGGIINPDPLEIEVEVGTTVYFVQDWQNLANRDDRANITVFDIPLDWEVTVYRDPTRANTVGIYTGGLNRSGWVWVATEYTTDSDDILDNNDNINPAADTGSDGVPDSDDLGPTGSPTSTTQVILEVTIPADAGPGTYTLRERGSSNNDWVEKKAITPTLAYNDESIHHDDTFKIVEIASEEATAVDLHLFHVHPVGNQIIVEWETATEIDTIGFNVTRAESRDGPWIQLNDSLIPSKALGSIIGASYEFVDDTAVPGITYYYCLDDIDTQGVITSHRHRLAVAAIPVRIYLPMLHK